MKLSLCLEQTDLNKLQYTVVVEMWESKNNGRIKRAWLNEFNENDRKKAYKVYRKFYNWHLKTGLPDTVQVMPSTYRLMQRLCNFFGTI